ncbi:MAG: nucleoside deaminase [Clostridiales Family XIII bacterium]|nr:nucleoside deaminase [Clostridiales Family XIII bacterium]
MRRPHNFINDAILEAKNSLLFSDIPIGTVIVLNNEIIGRGYNQVEKLKDTTAHAEILAIKDACKNMGNNRLLDCEVFTTLEPCLMCSGALILARIKKLYIGTTSKKTGCIISDNNLINYTEFNHKFEIEILHNEECSYLIKNFFKEKR